MNRLDEEESFHATRESLNHLGDIEYSPVKGKSSTEGETAISAVLESLDRDQQHAAVSRFIKNEIVPERRIIAVLHQQDF